MSVASPVDPLFLLLPALLAAAASNSSSLSDLPSILPPPLLNLVQGNSMDNIDNNSDNNNNSDNIDNNNSENNNNNNKQGWGLDVLKAVCETSEVGDEVFYRVSEDKVLAYLSKRAETLAEFFLAAAEDTGSSSLDSLIRPGVSSSFRGVASADTLSKGALAAAVELVCEYLPEAWRKKLRDAKDVVPLPEVATKADAPADGKVSKSYETDEQIDEAKNLIAASKRGRPAPDRLSADELAAIQAERVRKRAKEARDAEKQRKVEVLNRGTQSISSFFKPAAKGKGKGKGKGKK